MRMDAGQQFALKLFLSLRSCYWPNAANLVPAMTRSGITADEGCERERSNLFALVKAFARRLDSQPAQYFRYGITKKMS